MIEVIAVKNFKTLRDVRIPLAPGITVLLGANNSGKSNMFGVLSLLGHARTEGLRAAVEFLGGVEALCSKGVRDEVAISLEATFEERTLGHRLRFGGQEGWAGEEEFFVPGRSKLAADELEFLFEPWRVQFNSFMRATAVYDLSPAALRAPAAIREAVSLGRDGKDAAAVLSRVGEENPLLLQAINDTICRAVCEVKRVTTRHDPRRGTVALSVQEHDGSAHGAEHLSDGLLLFIGLAMIMHLKASSPGLLAIEQPERGLHPRRLRELVDLLLQMVKSGAQVVLTTQSPALLDEFRDSPESVLLFDRDERGTYITRLSDWAHCMDELQRGPLGDLWYSGVLGGVPRRVGTGQGSSPG